MKGRLKDRLFCFVCGDEVLFVFANRRGWKEKRRGHRVNHVNKSAKSIGNGTRLPDAGGDLTDVADNRGFSSHRKTTLVSSAKSAHLWLKNICV
jgi:hypothetical protein